MYFTTVGQPGKPPSRAVLLAQLIFCNVAIPYKLSIRAFVSGFTAPDLPQDGGAQLVAGHRPKAALGQNVQDGAAGVLPGLRRAHPPLLNEVGILLVSVAVKHGRAVFTPSTSTSSMCSSTVCWGRA